MKYLKKDGFTLIEVVVSIILAGLLFSATLAIFQYQIISTYRIEKISEMQDNLRVAAYWLTKDLRETTEVINNGNGEREDNAFVIKKTENNQTVYIGYFYGSGNNEPVLYRKKGTVYFNNKIIGEYQPLSNTYFFREKRGYIHKWSIAYDEEKKRADFTVFGSVYTGNGVLERNLKSSVYIRANP